MIVFNLAPIEPRLRFITRVACWNIGRLCEWRGQRADNSKYGSTFYILFIVSCIPRTTLLLDTFRFVLYALGYILEDL